MLLTKSLAFALLSWTALFAGDKLPEKISFNEHIRPIFSSTCFNCHGPDEHEAKARHLAMVTKAVANVSRTMQHALSTTYK